MSDILTKEQLRSINRQLAELREVLQVNDLVNKKQAMQITGVTSGTFDVYVSQGKYVVVSRNKAGQAFFSRKQLLGI